MTTAAREVVPGARYRLRQAGGRIVRALRDALAGIPPRAPGRFDPATLLAVSQRHVHAPAAHDEAEPVFLLATSWRTGSTLLQRLLMTDPGILVWGEPYGRLALIQRLTDAIGALALEMLGEGIFLDERDPDLAGKWVANLYPDVDRLRAALQACVVEWLAAPAQRIGYARWGLKEVRLDYGDACLLRWVFPHAKFVVVTRHPVDAYRSAYPLGRLWHRWPDVAIDSPLAFGRHWNRLALSWAAAPADFPVRVLRLEDVTAGTCDLDELGRFAGLALDPDRAMGKRLGATPVSAELNACDRAFVRLGARAGMRRFGYS